MYVCVYIYICIRERERSAPGKLEAAVALVPPPLAQPD